MKIEPKVERLNDVPTVSMLAIGNELLNGEIRDQNLYTLSRELTHLGFVVDRAVVIRDEPDCISAALHWLLASAPDVLICSGGLGPTEDDLTLSALALALGRPLELNADALRLVEAHYDRLLAQAYLTARGPEAARLKMASLPQGATPLPNPVGTAPGVKLTYAGSRIYALPGVPAELEAIFFGSIVSELRGAFALERYVEAALVVSVDDEAEVAEPLRQVARDHPNVYLKSLARPFPAASAEGLQIIAATRAQSVEQAGEDALKALADLAERLKQANLPVSQPRLLSECVDR